MNEKHELAAERRVVEGKKVRQLRHKGLIPATVYGHNVGSVSVQVERVAVAQLLREVGTSTIFHLKIGREQPATVLFKQLQHHPTSGELIHADFFRVAAREKLKMQVPLRFVGEAPVAETRSVAIVRTMDEVQVECYPSDLPSAVEADLSQLKDTDSTLRLRDLHPGQGVSLLGHSEEVVASVALSSKEVIAEAVEEAAEEAAIAEAAEPAEAMEERAEAA